MIFSGDFNVRDNEHHMKSFCENCGLKNLIRQPTYYKNPSNPVCIDLILINVPRSFQNTCVVETGLSDFHSMTLIVMRKSFKKNQPKIINYRSYKNFSNEKYRETLISPLIVTERFEQRNEQHYDLRKNSQFTIPPIRTVYHGSESISFLGPKIWNILPDRLKNVNSIEAFKIQIKKWKPENCPCRLCKVYVQNVGFV